MTRTDKDHRTENDHWDLATSVGATTTMVAAARAAASRRSDAVINDAFAAPLVRAVGVEFFIRIADGEFDDVTCGAEQGRAIRRLVDVLAVRTRHFDRFLTEAANSGISQIVLLAAGLDARSYRLRLPLTATVYEVDQPLVIAFKSKVIAGMGIGSLADRRFVGVDLDGEWPRLLLRAGFDKNKPTAWLAEGLLNHLPPETQDRLVDNITALSVNGSRFAADVLPNLSDTEEEHCLQMIGCLLDTWRDNGLSSDLTDSVHLEHRSGLQEYLVDRGWLATKTTTSELFAENGIVEVDSREAHRAPFALAEYISAFRH
jgi:methyltransferase (TIGR00027 family)